MMAVDPWHKPTSEEEASRYKEQSAALDDYLARERSLPALGRLDEDAETLADRHSPVGWGAIAFGVFLFLAAGAALVAHGCQ